MEEDRSEIGWVLPEASEDAGDQHVMPLSWSDFAEPITVFIDESRRQFIQGDWPKVTSINISFLNHPDWPDSSLPDGQLEVGARLRLRFEQGIKDYEIVGLEFQNDMMYLRRIDERKIDA